MKIVAYTYVDHQAEIGYPIGLATGNLDLCESIHFFGSDLENTRLLDLEREKHPLKDRISCHTIGVKINCPGDIASAQNACLEWIRKNEAFDFVIGLQADTMLGKRALVEVERISGSGNETACVLLPVDHVRTYAIAHRSCYGCAVFGKASRALFIGDGAYTDKFAPVQMAAADPEPYCVDVGYYTPEQYYRHVRKHAKTWNSPEGVALADTFLRDRDEFIRKCLRRVKGHERGDIPITPIDASRAEHKIVMNFFRCHDDYRHVCRIIEELRKVT